ncbi:uncharacterized mitochondrial protein AtMg00810-like [Hibiscus syriacus]|uniref:uncharacterized mitochondrial protein AtMg00810-like n=1 Tax=Hibiscus syriacus TaxID=106335 RepID=UPI0019251417|nr:uncharacterized mitochondrial protein AtMg00810-like [Hibiscus syriacus]
MRSQEGIILNQIKYVLELITDTVLGKTKCALTPLKQNLKLTSAEFDEGVKKEYVDALLVDKTIFQRLIGRFIYLTHTRPDITFAVHHLSQFMQKPKERYMDAALRIVRCIKKDPGKGLLFKAASNDKIVAYCDADWDACPMSRKFVTEFCIKIGDSLVSWKSKKQNTEAWP